LSQKSVVKELYYIYCQELVYRVFLLSRMGITKEIVGHDLTVRAYAVKHLTHD